MARKQCRVAIMLDFVWQCKRDADICVKTQKMPIR